MSRNDGRGKGDRKGVYERTKGEGMKEGTRRRRGVKRKL